MKIKIIIVISVIIGWLGFPLEVEAVIKRAGEIEVITDEPLFSDSTVWYPGLRIEKSFQVKNRGRGAKTVEIETENETETKQLSKVLTIQIKQGAKGIFGISESKTLRNFFDAAAISLGEVFGDDSGKTFSVTITMPAGAGNEYQGGRAKFDLRIGFAGESSSAVTVSGGGGAGNTEGKEGTGGLEGERQNLGESGVLGEAEGKEESEKVEGKEGSKGIEGERQGPGEVAGRSTEGINWRLLGIVGGLLASGSLAGWIWLRLRRKWVY